MSITILLSIITCIILQPDICVNNITGQKINQFSKNMVISDVRRVADNIVKNTSFKIIHTISGEIYNQSDNLPVTAEYIVESPYNDWAYWNGVLGIGMLRLGKQLDIQTYINYPLKNYDFIFNNLDYFEKQYKQKIKKSSFYQYFRMSKLDDCGAMAAGLCDVYAISPKPEYLSYLKKASEFIMLKQERLIDGTLARPEPEPLTIWADDLYMSVPFLARMSYLTGNKNFLNEAIRQVKQFHTYLYDSQKGLYWHSWSSVTEKNGGAFWGRCNGWVLMSKIELLSLLPSDYESRDELISLVKEQIDNLITYQDDSGLWHQIIDKPDSYSESSCTAMFIYGIARAVNEGWIDSHYSEFVNKGWAGLSGKINMKGEVDDICIGTGIGNDLNFYYERPVKLNDIHGLGAVLLAGSELIRMNTKHKQKP